MSRLPELSTATSLGNARQAAMADSPSPQNVPGYAPPLPATVVMICVAASTRRIRLFSESAMNRLPLLSTATPSGPNRQALVAGPPSPQNPRLLLQATVVTT